MATLMIVSFKITTKDDTSSRLMTRRLRAACSAPASRAVAFIVEVYIKEWTAPVIYRRNRYARVAALRIAFGRWRLRIVRHDAGHRQLVERNLLQRLRLGARQAELERRALALAERARVAAGQLGRR